MHHDTLRDVDISLCDGTTARLETYDTGRCDSRGKTVIGYRFTLGETVLFSGEDFCPGLMTADDSDECLLGLLGFLAIQPGDTDSEHFDSYTPEQMAWANSTTCESLSCDVSCAEYPETDEDRERKHELFTDRV